MCFTQLLQYCKLCVPETLSSESINTFISDKSSHAMPWCLAPSVLTAPQRTEGSRFAHGITLYNHTLQLTKSNHHFLHNTGSNKKYHVPRRCTSSIFSEFIKTETGFFMIEGGLSTTSTLNDKCRMKLDMV